MRSVDQARLLEIDSVFRASMQQAVDEQNRLIRRGDELTVELVQVGDRPSGETDPNAPLLLRSQAAIRLFGGRPNIQRSSTDSNVPISLGIPAVTLGAGGSGGRSHSLDEYWINRKAYEGVQRLLLILTAEAGYGEGAKAAR